jgi:hypothetical protein
MPGRKRAAGALPAQGLRILAGAAVGAAWFLPGLWGPGISALFLPLVSTAKSRLARYLTALAYYLTGSAGISAGAANFFGPGHLGLGILLWLSSAALLALPWMLARGVFGTLLALLLTALPPLGLIGWLSPLNAAGVAFPGLNLVGLGLFLGLTATVGAQRWDLTIALVALAGLSNLLYVGPRMPSGWQGFATHVHPTSSFMSEASQIAGWAAKARSAKAEYLLLPEDAAGEWLVGTQAQLEAAVPPGQTWLVGASYPLGHNHWSDAIVAVSHGGSRLLFEAPFTVPVSMWHPWKQAGHYPALWWEAARVVDGKRVWASICYSQLLPWVWLEGMLQRPGILLAPRNDWWAIGTGIRGIQISSTQAWSRLMGIPALDAENR